MLRNACFASYVYTYLVIINGSLTILYFYSYNFEASSDLILYYSKYEMTM